MDNPAPPAPPGQQAVAFEHTNSFPEVLERLRASLLVSTYQAGKLVVIGTHEGRLDFAFHSFEQVMGVAASPELSTCGRRVDRWRHLVDGAGPEHRYGKNRNGRV